MPARRTRTQPPITIRQGARTPQTATATAGRRRRTPLAALASRLTSRDLWLLDMLREHTVLTTHHLVALGYAAPRSANRRLATLTDLGLLDSFRPRLPLGSAPEHYVLGPVGARVLAARHATTTQAAGWNPELVTRTAYLPTLTHDLGLRTFMARLAETGRNHCTEAQLTAWWSEQRCHTHWGDLARPDAYAVLRAGSCDVHVFVEYDTGTEPHPRLADKLSGYADLADATGLRPLVLFTVHSTARETHLHQRLGQHHALGGIGVATSARDTATGTADWLPLGAGIPRRHRLTDLPDAWPATHRPGLTAPERPAQADQFPVPAPAPPVDPALQPAQRI